MKVFTLAIVIAIIGVQGEENGVYQKIAMCQKQTDVLDIVMEKGMNGDFIPDPKLKRFLLCYGKEVGLLDDAGNIMEVAFENHGKKLLKNYELVEYAVKQCTRQMKEPEETAYNLFLCFREVTGNTLF